MKHLPAILLLLTLAAIPLRASPIDDEALYEIPQLQKIIHPRMAELFAAAAAQPDVETRLEALHAIADYKLFELAPTLVELAKDDRSIVQLSVLHAAMILDVRDLARRFEQWLDLPNLSPEQRDLITRTDQILGQWGHASAQSRWLARLADRNAAAPLLRASAARALGQVFSTPAYRSPQGKPPTQVVQLLARLSLDADEVLSVRLACARALGRLDTDAGAAVAQSLSTGPIPHRLLAASAGTSLAAVGTQQILAADFEPAIAAQALAALLHHQSKDLLPWDLLAASAARPDPRVRELAYQGLSLWHTPQAISLLFNQLNDPHPFNRSLLTRLIVSLDQIDALRQPIRDRLVEHIASISRLDGDAQQKQWGAAEQLAHLAGRLDHKPAATMLVPWFDFPRHETRLATVLALRSLDVASTRPPMIALMQTLIDRCVQLEPLVTHVETRQAEIKIKIKQLQDQSALAEQVAFTLGIWREPAASDTLALTIPKYHPVGPKARVASIWSLGRIHEGTPHPLADRLAERLSDLNPLFPEDIDVRIQSAVAIGRMKSQKHLAVLRKFYTSAEEPLEVTCATRWAIINITAQPLPPITLEPYTMRQAFVRPLTPR